MATQPGLWRKKKTKKKPESFFPLNFNVYINLDNRERARAKNNNNNNNNGDQFRWKKNMKII